MTNTNSMNIASHLPTMAKKLPQEPAVIIMKGAKKKAAELSFSQIDEESNILAAGLEKIGIKRGVRTVLMVKPSKEFFSLTFALFKIGAVPVLVDPGMGIQNLGKCLEEAEPEGFIGIPKAHIARMMFRWAKSTLKINVAVGKKLFWGGWTLEKIKKLGQAEEPYEMAATEADEMAAILFTSGSTGVPKGAIYNHGNFCAQVDILKRVYGIQPGEIDLATFPLFALFGPALGMAVVVPDMDASKPAFVKPENIIKPIQNLKITNMFGSPALVNRVGRYGAAKGEKLPSLKRAISAGAPLSAVVLERFSTMLNEETQIFTPYGATEVLPVCSIGSHEILGETRRKTEQGGGVCVGKPIDEIKARIIKITDEPIETWSEDLLVPQGEIGEIAVQGPQVTKGYYNRPGSNQLSKIADPENNSFYHRMGDLGYFDDQGRIWFCGRKAHRVQTAQGALYTIPCEAVFNTHPQVFRTALVGVGKPGSQIPVLCVELEKEGPIDHQKIKEELLKLGATQDHTRRISEILFHPSFPVDIRHNSKIFREKLSLWAEGRLQ